MKNSELLCISGISKIYCIAYSTLFYLISYFSRPNFLTNYNYETKFQIH
jgi:hypothetical protein